ncbi:MAG: hypothetical protein P8177_12620 [Gemmatimonadota bacterium]|jgi:hypothetical protein
MKHPSRIRPMALVAALVALAACGDDPTTVEDHLDVEGIAIYDGTTEIYRYALDDGSPAPLTLDTGVHEVLFVLLDGDGDPLPEDDDHDDEEEHELRVDITDESILTWTAEDHDHDIHDFIAFGGELEGLQAGTTTLRLCVPHGGHCDFEVGDYEGGSGGIVVAVQAP